MRAPRHHVAIPTARRAWQAVGLLLALTVGALVAVYGTGGQAFVLKALTAATGSHLTLAGWVVTLAPVAAVAALFSSAHLRVRLAALTVLTVALPVLVVLGRPAHLSYEQWRARLSTPEGAAFAAGAHGAALLLLALFALAVLGFVIALAVDVQTGSRRMRGFSPF